MVLKQSSFTFVRELNNCVCFLVKEKLQARYAPIAERIILMALESVDYSEDKAIQILNIVVADKVKDDEAAAIAQEGEQEAELNLDLKK